MDKKSDYKNCKSMFPELLDGNKRWEEGKEHHQLAKRIGKFLSEHDFADYGDSMGWSFGGDGDNGETLLYQLDAFFEYLEKNGELKI